MSISCAIRCLPTRFGRRWWVCLLVTLFICQSIYLLRLYGICCQPTPQDYLTKIRTVASIFKEINAIVSREINCDLVINGDREEVDLAVWLSMHKSPSIDDYQNDRTFACWTCQQFKSRLVTTETSEEEAAFPLAFSLQVYKEFYQVEKLFRAIYRPYNFYCFHVDLTASPHFMNAVNRLVSCFPNVFVPDKMLEVRWGTYSTLDADLQCFKKLLSVSKAWKYIMNLTGQEYPIRTMRELHRILKVLNGSNSIEKSIWTYDNHTLNGTELQGIKFYKGAVHVVLNRNFVSYIFTNKRAAMLQHYLRVTKRSGFADETFFSTLNANPNIFHVSGAYTGGYSTNPSTHHFFARYKKWWDPIRQLCLSGLQVRSICIMGVRDIKNLNKLSEFFVNKFHYNWERLALQCMEYRFWKNSLADYSSAVSKTHVIPLTYYGSFDQVWNHL